MAEDMQDLVSRQEGKTTDTKLSAEQLEEVRGCVQVGMQLLPMQQCWLDCGGGCLTCGCNEAACLPMQHLMQVTHTHTPPS